MIVMKFGGTSVADEAAIERLMGIVRAARQSAIQPESQDWRGPVVVVSALGGATDKLLGAAADAGTGNIETARSTLRDLRDRHLKVANIMGASADRPAIDAAIHDDFDELDRIVGALG